MRTHSASAIEESHARDRADSIVVLGLGNLLWADEGFGVRCVEALHRDWIFSPAVALIDGGTLGIYLIDRVHTADRLLIFDAVDYGLAPGTLKLLHDDEVPRYVGVRKMSLHQTGFKEVLELARLTGHLPRELVLIGCQPHEIDDFGGSLCPAVMEALPLALRHALEILLRWGARPVLRDAPPTRDALEISSWKMQGADESLSPDGAGITDDSARSGG